jgi:predicted RNase H-like nuclease (RuvC/YqgF family)
MKTRLLPLLLSGLLLLSGCGNADTDGLKKKIAEQEQEIAQLKQRLETEALQAKALQSAVNQATVYKWAGPLRWLPIWDDLELQVGQEVREKRGWAPDWRAWALLGTLYIVAAGAVGAAVGAGIGALRRMQESDLLADKIRAQKEEIRKQEAALRKGQQQLERLRRSEEELEAAREELHETTRQIEEAERKRDKVREEVQALEQRKRNLPAEIEREKAKARQEYLARLEREQRAVRQATEKIDRALDDL